MVRWLIVVAVLLVVSDAAAMSRPIPAIERAIATANPHISKARRLSYAKAILTQARKHDYDPFTAVAIIWHESHFRATAESGDGEDIGLGGIRARYYGACRRDPEPVKNPSKDCLRTREALRGGVYNIRIMSEQITRWRQWCKKKTGRGALFQRWLAGYGGYNSPKKNRWCGQTQKKGRWVDLARPKGVREIMDLRLRLIRDLRRHRRQRRP